MATGVYHKINALKMRILWAHTMLNIQNNDGKPQPHTNQEIAIALGEPRQKISDAMCCYHKQKQHRYFRRLKMIGGYNGYRYQITKSGDRYLWKYLMRMQMGFDLSLGRRVPQTTPQYAIARAEQQADWEQRHRILEETGVFPEKKKYTKQELLNNMPKFLQYYIGITKHGALDMEIEKIEIT